MSIINNKCCICLIEYSDVNKFKNLCTNSKEHKICLDCYIDLINRCISENKDLNCPCCRQTLINIDNIDISNELKNPLFKPYVYMKNGIYHGVYQSYFLNGHVLENSQYINGIKHGKCTYFYSDGQKYLEYNYHKGLLNGECKIYHPNGMPQVRCFYLNDLLNDEYSEWTDDGCIKNILQYKNGKKHGKCIYYYEDKIEEVIFTD